MGTRFQERHEQTGKGTVENYKQDLENMTYEEELEKLFSLQKTRLGSGEFDNSLQIKICCYKEDGDQLFYMPSGNRGRSKENFGWILGRTFFNFFAQDRKSG